LSTYESVQLFIDRAQTVKPDFQVTSQNAASVAALCHRLEGIPLAIELAAARALVLTPAQMLRQLEHRFDFLVSRRRDGVERHQTLRAAIDWSYRLLAPEMQLFFAQLSVFRGGWTVEAAEVVCESGAPEGVGNSEAQEGELALDYLAQLQECSLVSVTENGEENRFRMLETLREFGRECLEASGETASLRQRHTRFFLALAQEAEPHLLSGDDPGWMRRLEAEYENVRTALEWIQHEERDVEIGLRVASEALYTYWTLSHRLGEGRERLRALLALPGPSVAIPVRATALGAAAGLAAHQRDHVAARSLYEDALALWRELGDDLLIAWTLSSLAWNARQRGDMVTARSLAEESVEVLQRLGNHEDLMLQLANLADHTHAQGDHATAHALYQRSLAILRELKDQDSPRMRSHMVGLANTAFSWGEVDQARGLYEEVLRRSRKAVDKRGIAGSLYWLGRVAQEQGDYGAAYSLCKESLARWHELQDKLYATGTLESLAVLALLREQPERASRLFGALEAYRESIGQPARSAVYRESIGQPARSAVHGRVVQDVDRYVSTVRDLLGEDGFAAKWAEGRALTFEQAVTYALEE
jgi:predicted ATPase